MKYRYIGSVERIYMDISRVVSPGNEVDWPNEAPEDGQWELVPEKAEPAKPAKNQRDAPAPPKED